MVHRDGHVQVFSRDEWEVVHVHSPAMQKEWEEGKVDEDTPNAICPWCGALHPYTEDDDFPTAAGAKLVTLSQGVESEVFFCSCGGTFAIATTEEKGAHVHAKFDRDF